MIVTFIAFIGFFATDFLLKILGFSYLYRTVKRWPVRRKQTPTCETILRVCSAVDTAATYYFKRAWCLQRSALTVCLLRTQGVPAHLVIGCRKFPFYGHAWVEVGGKVVNDDDSVQGLYTVLDRC